MSRGAALITGASSGIGAATARALAGDGWDVHVTARRGDRLQALAEEIGATAHVVDAIDREAMAALVEETPFALVVANAGRGAAMTGLLDATPEEIDEVIGVNVAALLHLAQASLKGMAARGAGHFISIGSVAGLYPIGPTLYGASKHAVRGAMRNLRVDLHGSGVRFTDIQPGRVSTEFYDVAVTDPARRAAMKETGIEELKAADIAEAIRWVAALPAHVNISALEITPTGQVFGGFKLANG